MRIQRIENERPTPKAPVTVKVCGNVIEVRHSEQGAPEITIEKLSADEYLDKRTGEIKEFQHTENRAENTASVAQTLRNLRDLINANLTDPERALPQRVQSVPLFPRGEAAGGGGNDRGRSARADRRGPADL